MRSIVKCKWGHVLPPSGLLFFSFGSAGAFLRRLRRVAEVGESRVFGWGRNWPKVGRLRPPPFTAIFLFQSHNKREKGGHLATLVELVEHIFVGRTELATVDGSTSGGEVHGIFSSLQTDFRDLKDQTERFPDFWNVQIWRQFWN